MFRSDAPQTNHVHVVGPTRAGRPTLDEHRCVSCGRSTRFMKRRAQCPANGTTAGGTLCFTCHETINTEEGTCIEWVAQRGPLGCQKCLKDCNGALFTCEICESEICESCTEDICLKKFFEEDISYFVCTQCIPLALRTNNHRDGRWGHADISGGELIFFE